MSSKWILVQFASNRLSFIQSMKRNPYTSQTMVNVTSNLLRARRFSTEHSASSLLTFNMKHDGWVAMSEQQVRRKRLAG